MNIDALVTTDGNQDRQVFDWGEIVWLDSQDHTGTDALTVGKVTIRPDKRNAEHYHPNCDESLYLLWGELEHTIGEEATTLTAGDLIHILEGDRHQATNTGSEDAVAIIVYNTGTRDIEFVDADSE